ncbi:MAG TPA: sigma 54-interacting transcriptional regulator [Bacteroidota bacterium]|nr:sigma 54-interacting transcriptional regulator [Bacteroidota bacterium]
MRRNAIERMKIGMTAALCCIAFYVFAPGFFDGVEKGLLPWMYRVRGEKPIDTSVVVIALTTDDIDALGGLPVKRSYYALAISALGDLGARVVGVDLGLTDAGTSSPEYNDLLASVIYGSGNVVLGGYFRSLSTPGAKDTNTTAPGVPEKFTHAIEGGGPWRSGYHFTLPYAAFMEGASGLGHTNLTDELTLPLYIGSRSFPVPLFSLEVLRRSMSEPVRIFSGGGTLTIRDTARVYTIPFEHDGDVSLNFTGGARSLRMYSFLEFLRAYDGYVRGAGPATGAAAMRGKIVLMGVAAEGRSSFVDSPFGSVFPAIGLHALFIDNALHDRLLRRTPLAVVVVILLLIAVAASLLISPKGVARGVMGVCAALGLYTALSFVLFANGSYVAPLFVCWFTGAVLIVTMLMFSHRLARGHIVSLEREKRGILATVREKEKRIEALRGEFEALRDRGEGPRTARLTAQIAEYKDEIGRLTRLSEDLEPFNPAPAGEASGPARQFGIVHAPSGGMAEIVSLIRKIATSDATVLITGESGSGKELVARAIHESSVRKGRPFVAVNCGALSPTLLESELFGHEKGAFTGALKEKPGRFELAGDGTIFLDEIGETEESFQVKLLRILQDGTYERVGGTVTLTSAARVVTATNRDLKSAVAGKTFRADLFYRLNVLAVDIPPLRERQEDIPLLAEDFLGGQDPSFMSSESVIRAFRSYPWPGNVRELQSAITRGVLLATADGRNLLRLKDLPEEITEQVRAAGDVEEMVIRSLREKGFSRSAISETADDIGGFNRGTVAEYFRGYCFAAFEAEAFDHTKAVAKIGGFGTFGPAEDDVAEKIGKKLSGYLQNAVEFADPAKPLEEVLEKSRPKFKNLPRKYHGALERIITAAHQGRWTV